MDSPVEHRVFSIQKANQAVKELRRTLPALRRMLFQVEQLEDRLDVLDLICNRSVTSENPDLQEYLTCRARYHRTIGQFEAALARLESKGYLIRDLEKGVVHFIGRRGGQQVLLCWREGEPDIAHWHPLHGANVPDERRRKRIENRDEF
jgi:hypothetical protein